jgi:hypothetical protein
MFKGESEKAKTRNRKRERENENAKPKKPKAKKSKAKKSKAKKPKAKKRGEEGGNTFMLSTKSSGDNFRVKASLKHRAESSMAPPNRGPMVSKPDATLAMMSLPARDATIVLCAPDTHGP